MDLQEGRWLWRGLAPGEGIGRGANNPSFLSNPGIISQSQLPMDTMFVYTPLQCIKHESVQVCNLISLAYTTGKLSQVLLLIRSVFYGFPLNGTAPAS